MTLCSGSKHGLYSETTWVGILAPHFLILIFPGPDGDDDDDDDDDDDVDEDDGINNSIYCSRLLWRLNEWDIKSDTWALVNTQ